MNTRQIAIIAAAIVVALGAFFWLKTASQGQQMPVIAQAPPTSGVKVLVAKRDIAIGERIAADAVGWVEWPAASPTTNFYVESAAPQAIEQITNAVVRQPMMTGEPIMANKLVTAQNGSSTMAALLTPGMRAVSLTINPESAVAGFILPNDRVDVILTRDVPTTVNGQVTPRTTSSVVLENVRVLAIDQNMTSTHESAAMTGNTATIELNTQDAEQLRLADKLGDLSLALRSYADASGPTMSRTEAAALSQPPPPAPANQNAPSAPAAPAPTNAPSTVAAAAQAVQVRVYRGGQ